MKQTKILATISDLKCDKEFLKDLVDLGANGLRLNTAHQTPDITKKVVQNIREFSDTVPIVIDTKGPEIRSIVKEKIVVKAKDIVYIYNKSNDTTEKSFYTSCENFSKSFKGNELILIDDGDVGLKCLEVFDDKLKCEVLNSGDIKNKKSINVPGVHIDLPSLTQKDKDYIDFCIENDIDFVAHSFVRNKNDVLDIQKILDKKNSKVKIIAKIENQEGVDNIDEILDNVYGIMIARGDLGIEIPAEKVPMIQKKLIEKCIKKRKLVITATQMLHSMIKNPRPTRAEVSDVANAIYDGTDIIMLSGETAYGEYPREAVQVMSKIAREIESPEKDRDPNFDKNDEENIPLFITSVVEKASQSIDINGIIANTISGRTARYLSSHRGSNKIFTECYDKRVARELALSYGVFPRYQENKDGPLDFIKRMVENIKVQENLSDDDRLVILGGTFGATTGASFMEIGKVGQLLNRKRI